MRQDIKLQSGLFTAMIVTLLVVAGCGSEDEERSTNKKSQSSTQPLILETSDHAQEILLDD